MRFVISVTLLAVATMAQIEPQANLAGSLTANLGGSGGLLGSVLSGQGGLLGSGLGGQGGGVGLLQGLLGSNGPVGNLVSGLLGPVLGGVLGSGGGLLGGGVGNVGGAVGDLVACLLTELLGQVAGVVDQVLSPLLGPIGGSALQVLPTTRGQCKAGDTTVDEGDTYVCLECRKDGFYYEGEQVTDSNQDTCCKQAADGYCATVVCGLTGPLSHCEVQVACAKRGHSPASRSFFLNAERVVDPRTYGANSTYLHAFIVPSAVSFRWADTGEELGDDIHHESFPKETNTYAELRFNNGYYLLAESKAYETENSCALCYDETTNLPPCA